MANPLSTVKSWLYHLGDIDSARAAEIGASDAGLLVIDYANYSGDKPHLYTPAELDTMRGGKDKLIVSYLSIGEAEDYRSYWKAAWDSNPPDFLSGANPEWPDNFKVKYWDPAWQKIVFDYVDQIIDDGFNGLYLDIIDAFQYWQDVAPGTGINYEQEMAKFVAAIDDHANAKLAELGSNRKFVIIGQNGEELVSNPTYLSHIDGLAKEDLRFYYPNDKESSFKPVPDGWFSGSKPYLEAAEKAGVEVFVVEYMTTARQGQYSSALQSEIDYLHGKDIPLYVAQDRDLTDIYAQPSANTPIDVPTGPTTPTNPPAPPPIDNSPEPPLPGNGATATIATTGDDLLTGTAAADKINALAGHDSVHGGASADLIHGNDGNDLLYGDDGNDSLYGDDGNDFVSGMAGNDLLYGGAGNDSLLGGTGNDKYDGGTGTDTAQFVGTTDIRVNLSQTGAQTTGEGQDTFTSIENVQTDRGNDRLTGNSAANLLDAGAGNDSLSGGGGNDSLLGGAGDDQLNGGSGDDLLNGGSGSDTALFTGSAAITVNLNITTAQNTGQGLDTLTSIERVISGSGNDKLVGNAQANYLEGGAGKDSLYGFAGNDTLMGGSGNDLLTGGTGNDVLTGGSGADQFAFRSGDGKDIITDFQDGIDHIVINSGASKFSDLTVVQNGADTVISFDDVSITLKAFDHTHLTASDLLIV